MEMETEPEPKTETETKTIPGTNTEPTETETKTTPNIQHLVLSGGGITGFTFYGALRASHNAGFWNINNIQSIYGTSAGSFFGMVMTLLPFFDWETIDAYLIHRPWHQLFQFQLDSVLQSIHNRGIFDKTVLQKLCNPFFEALAYKTNQPITIDVTMAEWYELTHIDLYFMITELTDFQLLSISHKTHPTWKLVDAIYASCALPIIFQPLEIDGKLYMDGGLLNDYPTELCIQNGADPDTIFGITRDISNAKDVSHVTSLFDYVLYILYKMLTHIVHKPNTITYELRVLSPAISLLHIYEGTQNVDERKRLIAYGEECWEASVFCPST